LVFWVKISPESGEIFTQNTEEMTGSEGAEAADALGGVGVRREQP
jgi:hypothetical protein